MRLPLFLLFVLVAFTTGLLVWLTLASRHPLDAIMRSPVADISLDDRQSDAPPSTGKLARTQETAPQTTPPTNEVATAKAPSGHKPTATATAPKQPPKRAGKTAGEAHPKEAAPAAKRDKAGSDTGKTVEDTDAKVAAGAAPHEPERVAGKTAEDTRAKEAAPAAPHEPERVAGKTAEDTHAKEAAAAAPHEPERVAGKTAEDTRAKETAPAAPHEPERVAGKTAEDTHAKEAAPAAPTHAPAGKTGNTAVDAPRDTGASADRLAGAAPARRRKTPPAAASTKPAPSPEPGSPPGRLQRRFKPPKLAKATPLSAAPDPALVEKSAFGPLPRIDAKGRKPWQVYARPFDQSDKRPRIAIVIVGLGVNQADTMTAIQRLPGAVTLAFTPYAERLPYWIKLARRAGHEILLNIPMEPENYPVIDPGPKALLTMLSAKENEDRLLWSLGRVTGYVGIADFMGSRFTMSRKSLWPVFKILSKRGLMFLDSRAAVHSAVADVAGDAGIPWAVSSRVFDAQATSKAIDADLRLLETLSKKDGRAIGMGSPFPVTLSRVAKWIARLGRKGIAVAPVSAVVNVGTAG